MEEKLTPELRYKEPLEKLVKFGKFSIMDATVKDLKTLNPDQRARRNIFLTDAGNKEARRQLKERLKKWHALLSESGDLEEMISKAQQEVDQSQELLKKNLKNALKETRDLEKAYRAMDAFFKNANIEKIKNLTILNASLEQLANPDFDQFRAAVGSHLKWSYGTLGKSRNYSLMVIPGYLGDNTKIKEWAKMAKENKVMLITDFLDLTDHESVIDLFDEAGYPDEEKTNIVMTCNWLIGRKAITEVGEEEALTIPPSAALAGKMYDQDVPISQPRAGKKYGALDGAFGVRFKMLMEHIGQLDERGLVPMVQDFGIVMPYSARTLFNGDDVGLKTYSVVAVFDWVGKVVIDFLNRAAFQNADQRMRDTYRAQIVKFLNSIKGPGKLIKNFQIKKFEPDYENNQPDRILVHIVMEPFFPAKSFALKMDGTSGEGIDNYVWNTKMEEIN